MRAKEEKGSRLDFESWQVWAVLSAAFAALTAIFAKIGVENINSAQPDLSMAVPS